MVDTRFRIVEGCELNLRYEPRDNALPLGIISGSLQVRQNSQFSDPCGLKSWIRLSNVGRRQSFGRSKFRNSTP